MTVANQADTNAGDGAIDFFAKLIAMSLPELEEGQAREQAASLVGAVHSLAQSHLRWSDHPTTPCPNHILQSFDAVTADGGVDGRVEIVLRRVRPGTPSFTELLEEHATYAAELLALRFRLDRIASISEGGSTGDLPRVRAEDLDEIKRQTTAALREAFFFAATNRRRIEDVLERAVNVGVGVDSLDLHRRVLEVARKREHDAKAALDAWMSVLHEAADGAG